MSSSRLTTGLFAVPPVLMYFKNVTAAKIATTVGISSHITACTHRWREPKSCENSYKCSFHDILHHISMFLLLNLKRNSSGNYSWACKIFLFPIIYSFNENSLVFRLLFLLFNAKIAFLSDIILNILISIFQKKVVFFKKFFHIAKSIIKNLRVFY